MQLNNSVETQTKVVLLRAYLNNQAMIKRILFIVHQNLNKPKTGRLRLFVDLFIPFCVIIVRAFSFLLSRSKHSRIKLCLAIFSTVFERTS